MSETQQNPELAAREAQLRAAEAAREAQQAARVAQALAVNAAEYAKELKATARLEALAGKKDSVTKGSLDLGPELKLTDAELAAKVRKGEVDGCLTELLELAIAHPRPGDKPGTLKERSLAIEALKNRGAKEPAKRE